MTRLRWAVLAVLILNLADLFATCYGLQMGYFSEANPLMNGLLVAGGIEALCGVKLLLCVLYGYIMFRTFDFPYHFQVNVAVASVYAAVVGRSLVMVSQGPF